MKMAILRYISIFALILSGCFQNADQSLKQNDNSSNTPVSEILTSQFTGALDARNKVTGISIRWVPASAEVSTYKVYRLQGRKLNLIATLPNNVSSFIDGDVTWGSTYSYLVKALDLNGIEDANTKTVSALAWGGIGSVNAESRESIRVIFDSPSPIVDEIRIYLTSKFTNEKRLVATVDGSTTDVLIQNLKSGYSYYVSAQAYVSSLRKEDGNEVRFEVATETEGFHPQEITPPGWKNIVNVRAFGESPNSPIHPVTPEKNPTSRVVEIAFNPFSNTNSTTEYVVIRTAYGLPIDTSVPSGCTESTSASCKVCELVGTTNLFCRDTKVASAPARYRYTMALVKTDSTTNERWVEPIPQDKLDQFSVIVPIPPENMVLVQRAAANYEMCALINQIPDPLNFNRCAYTGIGGAPYSTGHNKPALNLPRGFYDFGFNLFVDRYPLACNWTKADYGGMCGPSGTPGDCIGQATPAGTIGKEKDVYFKIEPQNSSSWGTFCFVKRNGAWRSYNDMIDEMVDNKPYLREMFTIDPKTQGGHRALTQFSVAPATTVEACKAFDHPSYGAKRLMRLREYRVLTAMPTLPNEPYYMTYNRANALRNQNTPRNQANGFGCDLGFGETIPADLTALLHPDNEVASYMLGGIRQGQNRFFLGAKLNVDCQSRYGVAHNFSQSNIVSDVFDYDAANRRYIGQISPVDNGNRDLLTDINGGTTGFRLEGLTTATDPGGNTFFYLGSSTFFNYVALPLGLPILSNSATGYFSRNLFTERYGDYIGTYPASDSPTNSGPRHIIVTNRWETHLRTKYFSKSGGANIRCVLPAE